MMILTINTGSSSVRLAVFDHDGDIPTEVASERFDLFSPSSDDPQAVLRKFMETHGFGTFGAAAHRVVHGGRNLAESRLIDDQVEQEIDRLASLAPLHNPVSLRWICATREMLGGVPQVAVFDTAFFAALPEIARTYAIPHELAEEQGLWRYGFHGLAHQAMWLGWRKLKPDASQKGRIVSLQLGSGCSITATANGAPRDTSMGFSPLEGLLMATRSGDIDASLITFLQRKKNLTPGQLDELLYEQSGLLGVSGISADIRQLLDSSDARARLAVDLYCYRARKYLGAYLAVLNGADAIIFGGGVGENIAVVRAKILDGMKWCGIELDQKKNEDHQPREISCISSQASEVQVWVIPVNEAVLLAQEAARVLKKL